MPIQVIAPIRDQRLNEQLALAQVLAQGVQGFQAYNEQQRAEAQRQALARLLGGAPADPGAIGAGTGFAGSPELAGGISIGAPRQPGLLPGATPELAAQLVEAGLGPTAAQVGLQRLLPASLTPYQQAQLELKRQELAQQQPKAPPTRDVLQGNERVFQQFDPATGQWVEVGRGPAFAPPTQINVDTGIKVPSGFMLDPNDPNKVIPIPGGPEERVEGPAAAGLTLLPNAIAEIPGLRGALFNPDGSVNRQAVATMNAPYIGAIPGTAGEGYRAAMQAGTMAILRVESGGAVTRDEIDNKLDTYMPGPLDTDDVARQKFERYTRDLNNAFQTLSRGRGEAPTVPAIAPPAPPTGPVDKAIGEGVEAAREAVAPRSLPSMDQLQQMTAAQVDALVGSMSDEQLRQLPAGLLALIEQKLAEQK